MERAFALALIWWLQIQLLLATSTSNAASNIDAALAGSVQSLDQGSLEDMRTTTRSGRVPTLLPLLPTSHSPPRDEQNTPTSTTGAKPRALIAIDILGDRNTDLDSGNGKRKRLTLSSCEIEDNQEIYQLASGKHIVELKLFKASPPLNKPRGGLLGSSRSAFRKWNDEGTSYHSSHTFSHGLNPIPDIDSRGASYLNPTYEKRRQSNEAITRSPGHNHASINLTPSVIQPHSTHLDRPEQFQNSNDAIPGSVQHGHGNIVAVTERSPSVSKNTIREFNVEHMNLKVWAWISIIYEHIGAQVASEFDRHAKKIMIEFKADFLPQLYHPSINVIQQSDSILLENQITAFITSLWAVNLRVLECFGSKRSRMIYLQEQKNLIRWFTSFLLTCNQFTSTGPSNRGMFEPWIGSEGLSLHQKIMEAIQLNEGQAIYKVYREHLTPKALPISPKDLLINKAVVTVLGFYYKNYNPVKWDYIFEEDGEFVIKFSNFGAEWKDRPYLKYPIEYYARDLAGSLLPWKLPGQPDIMKNFANYLKSGLVKFEKWVSPLDLFALRADTAIGEIRNFKIRHNFYMEEDQDETLWAWIARLKLDGKAELHDTYKPDLTLMRTLIARKLEFAARKTFNDEAEGRRFLMVSDKQALARLERLFDLLWAINGKFLESIGAEVSGQRFRKEQKRVQFYLQFMFLEENNDESGSRLRQFLDQNRGAAPEALHQNRTSTSKSLYKTPSELIMELIFLKENKVIYQVKRTEMHRGRSATIFEMDLIMSKTIVAILGFYYKNENHEKWKLLFKHDTDMFKWLVKSSTRLYYSSMPYCNPGQTSSEMRALQLIPWAEKLEHSIKTSSQKQLISL
ncbi:hypothetical protein PGT21_018061 [Puccinia graminis f. sp. tritici]|uniref:Uncharacterized protein n=1 Tax=Puccinia graminis f. sp. tritici TaxID=56615 RepID=A0A5B0PSH5_PUCGR|nr:hypothetical protein PGT21_018061 [Puccinia graminis f. sp. tritici]